MTTDQPTTPPTAHVALEALARSLEALGQDATWLPPTEVARLVREFAATIPVAPEQADAGPDPDPEAPGGVSFAGQIATEQRVVQAIDEQLLRTHALAVAAGMGTPNDEPEDVISDARIFEAYLRGDR